MDRLRLAPPLLGVVVSLLAACSSLTDENVETSEGAVATPGRWKLPSAVAEAGADVQLHYDGAPNWNPRQCSGGLKAGALQLGEFLQDKFPAISSVGGYACRRNTAQRSKMSVHGTGRALDIFIPTTRGAADNGKGDAIANYLVMNAERIGVQLIIWDRTQWQANGRNDKAYTGPSPHIDHLHVELTIPAATMQTPFFRDDAGLIDIDGGEANEVTEPTDSDAGTDPDPNDDPDPDPDPDSDPDPDPDNGGPPPDPTPGTGTSSDGGSGPASSSDAGSPSGDSNVSPPTGTAGTEPEDTSTSSREPLPEEEPVEGESEGTSRRAKKQASDGGCSAAPTGSSRGGAFVAPLALVVAATLVRRRRRTP